jgi:peptide/nickel transport system permease protein
VVEIPARVSTVSIEQPPMKGFSRYLAMRLASLLAALFIVSLIAFVILRLMPGDPATAMLPVDAQLWQIEAVRESLGLDQPLPVQYLRYLARIVRFDFGDSFFFRQPVSTIIMRKAEATFLIAVASIIVATAIGIPIGVAAAARRGTLLDQSLMATALISVSIPNFWLGLMLILTFSVERRWFPVTGWVSLSEDPLQTLRFLVLPTIALGTGIAASIARMTRSATLEVLSQDYVRTARAKGVEPRVVLYKHALRNSIIPVMATIALSFSLLLGGATVTETVFSIPGLGAWMVDSVGRRDFVVLEALLLLFAFINLTIHLVVDIMYGIVDPRVQYE